jgi:hypothetical protein
VDRLWRVGEVTVQFPGRANIFFFTKISSPALLALMFWTGVNRPGRLVLVVLRLESMGIYIHSRRSEDGIPVGARFSARVQTDPWAHPAPYKMGNGFLYRG